MFELKDKIIVVSGASGGIGKQCAITCSKMGARLILFGRNEELLKQTQSELNSQTSVYFAQDITNIEDFESAISKVVKEVGRIDGFIHSAGIQSTLPLRLHNKDIYQNQFNVNVIAGFEACRVLTNKNYFNINGGSIILISSIKGFLGAANQVGYSSSKGAVIAGAKSLAIELAPRNIRVNSVSPGMVEDTKMTKTIVAKFTKEWTEKNKIEYPLGWVSTEDIANTCVFLLSEESKKITGTNIIIDGGFSAK